MAARIVALVLTLVLNVAAGVVIFFMMLIAMNGFHGSDAEWGLGAYIILAALVSLIMSIGAVLLVGRLIKRQFSGAIAAVIAVPVFTVVGVMLKVVSSVLGILVADYVRVNY